MSAAFFQRLQRCNEFLISGSNYVKNGSGLSFILLVSTIMASAILVQSYMRPKQDVDPEAAQGAASLVQQESDATAEPLAADATAGDQATDSANSPGAAEDASAVAENSEPQDDTTASVAEVQRTSKDEFVQMGSLSADGSDRYLVTINKRAATIHRVELNFRDKRSGRFKYRDLVWKGGYLGSLACEDTPEGCTARLVGKGTPAQLAGIEPGDVIVSINGEPVVTAVGLDEYLDKKTKPNTTVEVQVKRNGATKSFNVALTQKPLSVIRPESNLIDENFVGPESFVLSLIKPMQEVEKAWPDLDRDMRTSNWEVTQATDSLIELKFDLSEQKLDALGLKGPLTVVKRFGIPELLEENTHNLRSRSFHLDLEIEVQNKSEIAQRIAYELDGPTGLTAETWWYANKIHGRQTALFYMAGARDVIGSTNANSYIFYGCPELVKGAQKTIPQVNYICEPLSDPKELQLNFAGVDSQYFNVSLLPKLAEGEVFEVNSVSAYPNNRHGVIPEIPKNARLQRLVDCTFQMAAPIEIPGGGSTTKTFEVFCGPKDITLLDEYGLGDARTFGWFSWCSIVLLKLLHFFYFITGSWSYGLSIVLLTVLVRCLMIPFSRKAALNAQMMQHLAPQMKEITEKYTDMEKRSAAQRELYKKHNFNPFGGCFMMFFQLPIFYGLYKALNVDIALRDQPLLPGMQWCSNLAAPDQLMYWKDSIHSSLGDETGWLGPYLNILPLITMVLFIAQQKLFTPPPTDDNQKMMQKMMTFMMVAMGVMFFKVPAGLCLYFITSSLWGIIERKLLPKPVLDTEKLGLVGGGAISPPTKSEMKKQSKAEKAEEIAREKREAEAEERRQRNADRKKRLKNRGSQ